jgi:hypothetical protein
MSDAKQHSGANQPSGNRELDEDRGPSLKLLYTLIALALAAAIAIAGLIVLPFYRGR